VLELLTQPETWISLTTLTAMEVVLGLDNIVFLSILVGRLPATQQPSARRLGLALALLTRLGLLFAISSVMGLTAPFFTVMGRSISGRELILLGGGLFLIGKATFEIHDKLETRGHAPAGGGRGGYWLVIAQVAVLDIVFSLDSVITAVGMARALPVMVAAMLVAVGVMLVFAGAVGRFVDRHPTMKMLALSFLILIGVMLVAEGLGQRIDKGYIYFAMAFSLLVELLNLRLRKHSGPAAPGLDREVS
jgi:predicted tellurium resistance membrane protein TerC